MTVPATSPGSHFATAPSFGYARIAAAIVGIVGVLSLIGWIFNIPAFKSIYGPITMKGNTALGLTLSASSLMLFTFYGQAILRVAGQIFAFVVFLIGTLTLSEHIVGWDLGIDQLIFQEPQGAIATASPGRMGPPASSSFVLLGTALLLLYRGRSLRLIQCLSIAVILIATLPVLGYVYKAEQLYGIAHYTGIAFHTAISLLMLGTGVLSLNLREGLTAVMCGKDIAGAMARRLMIPALIVPFIVGWIVLTGQRSNHLDVGFAIAFFALAIMSFFTFAIWRTANILTAMENRTKQVEAQIRKANQLKDEFLATISHELRTPLNSILGWATMLQRHKLEGPVAERAVEIIERSARVQAQLIEDLLDVSRIVSGKLRLDPGSIELKPVIQSAIDSVRFAAEAKQIVIATQFDPSAGEVMGDPTRLQQVVWNLLSNAVKFTPPGGVVEVKLENINSRARITVTDNGPGIAADFLPYVFDRFQQEDGTITRKHGGLGLGLAIVRHLVELHGGTIHASSNGLGKGASFQVEIPLLERQSEPTSNVNMAIIGGTSKDAHASNSVGILSGKRILVVDDEQDARDMLNALLGRYGATIAVAASVKEALSILVASKPDLLVCDIGMPDEDGYSLIRKVRELHNGHEQELPAIALTGYVQVEERIRALREGFQMFVAKPVEPDELISSVVSLLDASRPVPEK